MTNGFHSRDLPMLGERSDEEEERPSRVVLLRNMIGPGDMDEQLEEETADECRKVASTSAVMSWNALRRMFCHSSLEMFLHVGFSPCHKALQTTAFESSWSFEIVLVLGKPGRS
mmetsp:Transcript_10584/g.21312  ORF Transcript_10584/g.21312 Transcript_10584/m.21312 type:complete len:114 (-) Transcript_10584:1625-1966(-)